MKTAKPSRLIDNPEKRQRFSIRKFSLGVASVAIAAFWMLETSTVAANDAGTQLEDTQVEIISRQEGEGSGSQGSLASTESAASEFLAEAPNLSEGVSGEEFSEANPVSVLPVLDFSLNRTALEEVLTTIQNLDQTSLTELDKEQLDYYTQLADKVSTQAEIDELVLSIQSYLNRLGTEAPGARASGDEGIAVRSAANKTKETVFKAATGITITEVDGVKTNAIPTTGFTTTKPEVTNMQTGREGTNASTPTTVHHNPSRYTFAVIYTAHHGDFYNTFVGHETSGQIWFGNAGSRYAGEYYHRSSRDYTRVDQIAFATDENGSGKVYVTYYSGTGGVVKEDVFEAGVDREINYNYRNRNPQYIFRYATNTALADKANTTFAVDGPYPEGWFNELYTNYTNIHRWQTKNRYISYGWDVPDLVDKPTEFRDADTNQLLGTVIQTELSGYSFATQAPKTIKTSDGTTYELVEGRSVNTSGKITPLINLHDSLSIARDAGYIVQHELIDADGTIAWYVLDQNGNRTNISKTSTPATGNLKLGETTTVNVDVPRQGTTTFYIANPATNLGKTTYYYKASRAAQTGSVVVKYVDDKGTAIPGVSNRIDTPEGTPVETPYNTTDQGMKPEKLTSSDNKVYYFKEVAADSVGKENGQVAAGETVVTYVYEQAGSVLVNYKVEGSTELNVIKPQQVDQSDAKPGTQYTTADQDMKPDTITHANKTYKLVPELTENAANETGSVEAGVTKQVTYVYREVVAPKTGSVIVNYVNGLGQAIRGPETKGQTSSVVKPTGTPVTESYDTRPSRPDTITVNGRVLYLVLNETKGQTATGEPAKETGQVTPGQTTITYVYRRASERTEITDTKGSVVVKYVDDKGQPLSGPETGDKTTVVDTPETIVSTTKTTTTTYPNGSEPKTETSTTPSNATYDTAADHKPQTITKGDRVYYLVRTEGTESGTLPAGETVVTYHYAPATVDTNTTETKGSVVVKYVDDKGQPLSGPETGDKTTVVDTPETIVSTTKTTTTTYPNGSEPKTETSTTPSNATYDTAADHKPQTITKGDRVYYLVRTEGTESGTLPAGETVVTYHYAPATVDTNTTDTKGSVVVKYVDDKGQPLSGPETGDKTTVVDTPETIVSTTKTTTTTYPNGAEPTTETSTTPSNATYDTAADHKPQTITKGDRVYYLVRTEGTESGTLPAGETVVTYHYAPATVDTNTTDTKGSVVVKYVDENGQPLSGPETGDKTTVVDTPETIVSTTRTTTTTYPNGSEPTTETSTTPSNATYDTAADHKPQTITKGDRVYYLVRTEGTESGTLPAGETVVTYHYAPLDADPSTTEARGTVKVRYITEAGQVLEGPTAIKTNEPVGTSYRTEEKQFPGYTFVKVDESGAQPSGQVSETEQLVTYVYKPVTPPVEVVKTGTVKVRYITESGQVLEGPTAIKTNEPVGTSYRTEEKQFPGYTFVKVDESGAQPSGQVSETEQLVTYVYKPVTPPVEVVKTGTVKVRYITESGQVLEGPTAIKTNEPVGTSYRTEEKQFPGYTFVKVDESGAQPSGQVSETEQLVTYVYKPVTPPVEVVKTGTVKVRYITESGQVLEGPTAIKTNEPVGTSYRTEEKQFPGYTFVKVDESGAQPSGQVSETEQLVTYVYKPVTPPVEVVKTGTVKVRYITESGQVLEGPTAIKTNEPVGTLYRTEEKQFPGYTFVKVDESGAQPSGQVSETEQLVTYVYKPVTPPVEVVKTGTVKVRYITESGQVLEGPTAIKTNEPVGTSYRTEEKQFPGYTFVKVDESGAQPSGQVSETEQLVTYVYKPVTPPAEEVKGNVVVHYVNEAGETIKGDVVDTTSSPVGTAYNTTDNKPGVIVTEDGTRYVLVPAKSKGSEEGQVVSGTTHVTYVYAKAANWVPLIPGVPTPPKVPYPFDPTNPDQPVDPGKPIVPGGDVPVIPYVPGYEPELPLVPVDPEDPTKGYIPPVPEHPGVDTPIPYKQVKGNVVVHYVNEAGETIKDNVVDTTSSPVGTAYNTTDNKPGVIVTEDGTRYVLVPAKTKGSEEGKVVAGTTHVTYVYAKAANWVPLIPGVPTPPTVPYPFDPTNPDQPVDPDKPSVPGGDVPMIPYVPGYEPELPLVPVDPEDPTKGYIPPVPEHPGVDTPIPYKQVKGDVVVRYENEAGETIKDNVVDTTSSPVGTAYNTTDHKPGVIVTEDGTRYVLVPAKTQGSEDGQVVQGTTHVTYVYAKAANWVPLIPGVPTPPKVPYPFDPTNPDKPVDPGKPSVPGGDVPVIPYVPGYEPELPLVPVDPEDPTKGYIPPVPEHPGVDTPIPYKPVTPPAEEVKGNVVVHYVNEAGETIKSDVVDTTSSPVGTAYNTTDHKPGVIVTEDGTRYVLVPAKTKGSEEGQVVAGTTHVTYVYAKAANWIPLIPGVPTPPTVPYPFDPTNPDQPVDPGKPSVPGGDVPLIPYVPGYEPELPLVPVDSEDPTKGYIPPVPEHPGVDTPIPYKPVTPPMEVVKTGTVKVRYITESGQVLEGPTAIKTNEPVGTSYRTEEKQFPGYTFVKVDESGAQPSGQVSETEQLVTYVYKPVTPPAEEVKGNVVVHYVNEAGETIKGDVVDTTSSSVGTAYNTTDHKPGVIVIEDGTRYVLVPAKTKGSEEGKVVSGTTHVTYVYAKAANWIPLIPGVPTPPTVPYPFDPTNPDQPVDPGKPIVPGGDVPVIPYVPGYEPELPLVPVDPEDPTKGYIPPVPEYPGVDTLIPYKPVTPPAEEVKGNVVVHYVNEAGETIKGDVVDTTSSPVGTAYNTTDHKPGVIVTEDGTRYVLVPAKTKGSEEGQVVAGTTHVTYVYAKAANWIPLIPGVPTPPTVPYPFDPTNPGQPVDPGKPSVPGGDVPVIPYVPGYEPEIPLVPVDPEDPTKGYIPPVPEHPGVDTPIPYKPVVPAPKQGTVIVTYINEAGETIKGDVVDTTSSPVGTAYNTTDNKPGVIVTEDGTRYVLVPAKTKGSEEGQVVAGTTHVTYVYAKAANWVPLIPGVPTPPKVPYPFDPTNPDKPVDPGQPIVPGGDVPVIPYVPGYEPELPLVPVDPEDPTKGYIPPVPEHPGVDTPIPYKPVTPPVEVVKTGTVKVRYITESGQVLEGPTAIKTNEPVGTSYRTEEKQFPGYTFVKVDESGAQAFGQVSETEQLVTYVYKPVTPPVEEVKGNVVVHYVNEAGETIKGDVVDTTSSPVGTAYNTTDNKPGVIVTEDDTRYVLVPAKTKGAEEGKVVAGTIHVTYVYAKAANWVPLIPGVPTPPRVPYPFDPTNPDKPVDPGQPIVPGGDVPVIPYVPGYEPELPLVPVNPEDPTKGYIPPVPEHPGVDTPIPYKPVTPPAEEVKGNVVVRYENEAGETIKDNVVDTTSSPVGTAYNTTDNKPGVIVTEDGTRYVLVPAKTKGSEEGQVVSGTTHVTYVYAKAANWIPLIPGVPTPPKVPYPFDPTNPDKPVDPGKPSVPGGDVPVIPYVPGYEPELPLVPVDPEDPTKGYIPPVPEHPGVDTPIPYKPVTPPIPGVPNEPVNPTPSVPIVPVIPTPVDPGQPIEPNNPNPEKPVEPMTPAPGQPTPPAKPELPEPVTPTKPEVPRSSQKTLPHTGDSKSVVGLIGGFLFIEAGLLSRRRKEG